MQNDLKSRMAQAQRDMALQAQKDSLSKMIDLVPKDRRSEFALALGDFKEARDFLSSSSAQALDQRYVAAGKPIEAIEIYLTDLDQPAKEKDIVEDLLRLGYKINLPPKRVRGNIKKSFGMHLEGQAKGKSRLKRVNDLIGLGKWEDDRFKIHP